MKPPKKIIGIIGSVAEGMLFIWGILFAGWSPMLAAFGYWIEEAVVFLITLAALIIMRIGSGRRMFIPRFAFIYGFIFFIHTIFFTILAGFMSKSDPAAEKIFEVFFWLFLRGSFHYPYGIMADLLLITAVVTASCLYTVIFRIRRAGPDPSVIINRSLGAIIAPHFILLFGIGGIMLADAPSALVVVLIMVKVLIDLSGFADRGSAVVSPEET